MPLCVSSYKATTKNWKALNVSLLLAFKKNPEKRIKKNRKV